MAFNVQEFTDGLFDWLKGQFDPVLKRLEALENKEAPVVDTKSIITELGTMIPKAGMDGKDGKDGEPGPQGEKGDPGESVPLEQVEKMIADAVQKAVSALPKPEDGKDALQIEILPFDETKSYPRGSYVSHRGGLLRAFQKTDGLKGFDVVLNGVADSYYGVEDDKRTFVFSTELTDGTVTEHKTVLPVMIYKGIYSPDNTYLDGDVVTYNGSSWVVDGEVKGKPGTPDSGFKMMVKSGRDKHVVQLDKGA